MKIAFIVDGWEPIVGGGQKLFWEIAKRLVLKYRCSIVIITRSLKDDKGRIYNHDQNFFKDRLKIIRLGPSLKWNNLFGRLFFPIQAAFWTFSSDFDLIHGSSFLPGVSLQIINFLKKIPITFCAIGFNHFWQETNPGIGGRFYQLIERIITEKFHYNWLITDDYDFYKKYKKKNISFITNGVKLWSSKKENKWPEFTFLFVGRLDRRKGVNYLLKAFARVISNHKTVHLRIVGRGEEENNYKKLCRKLKVGKSVRFVGWVTETQKEVEYKKAHCLVLPSLWEGHPLVLFEAWAAKLPIIATKVGSLNNFIKENNNGYLVKPKNSEELYKAMLKALANKNLSQLGEKGHEQMKSYSWEKTTENYYAVFKKLLQ